MPGQKRSYSDKCSISWLEKWMGMNDGNHDDKVGEWAMRVDSVSARCSWCGGSTFRYANQGGSPGIWHLES